MRQRPAWRLGDKTENTLLIKSINLVDHSVNVITQLRALSLHSHVVIQTTAQTLHTFDLGVDRKTPVPEPDKGIKLGIG